MSSRSHIAIVIMACICQTHTYASDAISTLLDWRKVVAAGEVEDKIIQQAEGGPWSIGKGSFEMPSGMAEEPRVICFYATPEPKSKKMSPRRHDAVYFFHTPGPGTRNILDDGICQSLVAKSGMTVFGIAFQQTSRSRLFYDISQRNRYYTFAKSGSFIAILNAWTRVRTELHIASPRFFTFGYSAGGIGAQHFAEEYPECCDGVVTANGHTFVQNQHATCPYLIIHTYGDGGLAQGDGLATYCRIQDAPCVRLYLNPNWGMRTDGNDFAFHALNPSSSPLTLRFLEAIADLRRNHPNGIMPPASEWPYAVAAENPQLIIAVHGKEWKTTFKDANLTAMPIPSARFYAELMRIPPPNTIIDIPALGPVITAKPAPNEIPIGAVVVWHRPKDDQSQSTPEGDAWHIKRAEMDLRYAVEHHFLAATTARIEGLAKALPAALANAPMLGALPVSAVLFEPGPNDIGIAASTPGLRNLVVVLPDTLDVTTVLPILQKCVTSGVRIQVLVSCENKEQFDVFLHPVNPVVRESLFAPFRPRGQSAEMSLDQQQIEAAIAFLAKMSDKH